MDRLTHECFSRQADFCSHTECELYGACPALENYNRLKSYEDTGYSPEDFDRLCREMSAIRCALGIATYEQLRDIVENGRLLVLPCKVGDTVYQTDGNRIYPSTINMLIYDAGHIAFDERAIGKTVFLTSEAAEKKLAEMRASNG